MRQNNRNKKRILLKLRLKFQVVKIGESGKGTIGISYCYPLQIAGNGIGWSRVEKVKKKKKKSFCQMVSNLLLHTIAPTPFTELNPIPKWRNSSPLFLISRRHERFCCLAKKKIGFMDQILDYIEGSFKFPTNKFEGGKIFCFIIFFFFFFSVTFTVVF